MMKKADAWDNAEFLANEEDVCAYISAAMEEDNPHILSVALGNVARAKGMTQLPRETGITPDSLYKALSSDENPSFNAVQKVLKALGLRLNVVGARQ
jgi:probable addiction module antidote protein